MTEPRIERRWERVLSSALVVATIVVFITQLRSVAVFPQPNSLRWFGDETWLMSEARQQITTGVVRYPLALGSVLQHGKGMVLSMTWLSSVLYGIPVWLAGHNIVVVGRMVTAFFSAGLLIALFIIARRLGASRFLSASSILLLACTRSFFFSSHSARPDILAGLTILLFVGILTQEAWKKREHSSKWWFGYGVIVTVLAVTSSIHLLTLLVPVAIFFFVRMDGLRHINTIVSAISGALVALALLIGAYYTSTGNLALFAHSTGHVQFNDVLTSIPIFRPFSRSVQVANILIRLKEFWLEAPVIFLLPVVVALAWRRTSNTHTFAIATAIVFLSWLLLQGTEINYLIHILPLLFVALAIGLTRIIEHVRWVSFALVIFSAVFFVFAIHDSSAALESGSIIDRSNKEGVAMIKADLRAESGPDKPCVVTEPVTLARLSDDTSIQVMTDHFISFPIREQPLDSLFAQEHVNYIMLYNSPTYPKIRPKDDPFYQAVKRSSQLVATYIGTSGDMGRDYFDHSNWKDTLLLFKFPRAK